MGILPLADNYFLRVRNVIYVMGHIGSRCRYFSPVLLSGNCPSPPLHHCTYLLTPCTWVQGTYLSQTEPSPRRQSYNSLAWHGARWQWSIFVPPSWCGQTWRRSVRKKLDTETQYQPSWLCPKARGVFSFLRNCPYMDIYLIINDNRCQWFSLSFFIDFIFFYQIVVADLVFFGIIEIL